MAPGIGILETGGVDFPSKLTKQVFVCTIIAAIGGLMFGYDIGISGGVTSMDDFLVKFFPDVYVKKHHVRENNYCKYNNVYLQLFTSSLYLAAILASFTASFICKKHGRRPTIQWASVFFVLGAIMNATAVNLIMLIIGRMFLGIGVGFGNQAVPLFISEVAPAKYRGALNICFQLLITVGILIANIINYFTTNIHPNGWRVSLGGAAIPALILLIGSLTIVETPTSLIERGKKEEEFVIIPFDPNFLTEGRSTLQKIRGVDNVDQEFDEIVYAVELSKKHKHSFRNLMKRKNRPQLFSGTILQIFQQLTGINVIMFYAPVLFQTMGFENDASLLSAVLTGGINVVATFIAIFTVDKVGRKVLLLEAAGQMIVAQSAMGVILAQQLHTTSVIPKHYALAVVALVGVFVSGFAWSWGPLGWLIASEIFPLETRNAGFFFAVSMNMLCTFLIGQLFLSMLCVMKWGIFFFFVAWIVVMGIWAAFWLPETKGIPIDEMNERAWKKHWFWKKYFDDDNDEEVKQDHN